MFPNPGDQAITLEYPPQRQCASDSEAHVLRSQNSLLLGELQTYSSSGGSMAVIAHTLTENVSSVNQDFLFHILLKNFTGFFN